MTTHDKCCQVNRSDLTGNFVSLTPVSHAAWDHAQHRWSAGWQHAGNVSPSLLWLVSCQSSWILIGFWGSLGFLLTQDSEITKPQPRPETKRRHHKTQTWMIRRDLGHSQRVTVYGINLQHMSYVDAEPVHWRCIFAYLGVFFPDGKES